MRNFGTRGPVNPQENYIVSRTEETADFSNRIKEGRYIVLFAPRQSGKTTFFQLNLHDELISELATYGVIGEAPDGRCEILNPIYLSSVKTPCFSLGM